MRIFETLTTGDTITLDAFSSFMRIEQAVHAISKNLRQRAHSLEIGPERGL